LALNKPIVCLPKGCRKVLWIFNKDWCYSLRVLAVSPEKVDFFGVRKLNLFSTFASSSALMFASFSVNSLWLG